MSSNEKLWQLEREFWLGDADFYKANLAEDAVMRFPDPVGLLQKEETIKILPGTATLQTRGEETNYTN